MTRLQSRTATTVATSADGGWHALSANEALAHHGVDPAHGLAEGEAATRLARHGPNRPSQQPGRSALSRFFGQMKEPLVLVLIASGVVTGALGEWIDSSVIFGVVLVNAVIGYPAGRQGGSGAGGAGRARSPPKSP
jgi:magnesium-transporting ATPase (P-type)